MMRDVCLGENQTDKSEIAASEQRQHSDLRGVSKNIKIKKTSKTKIKREKS